MPLPAELSTIFKNKQKSYKMVLVLSLLQEYQSTKDRQLQLSPVAGRFLEYYQNASGGGKIVDTPPGGAADWHHVSLSQVKMLLKTPTKALSSILESSRELLTFKPDKLDDATMKELEDYARSELDAYNRQLAASAVASFFLHKALTQIV